MTRGTVRGGDEVMKALDAMITKAGGGSVSVGFPEGAKYPNGTSVAQAAWWAEFGHGGQFPAPPRPFFRTMITEESPQWPTQLAGALKFADGDGNKALDLMGHKIEGQLRESIINFAGEPLSPTTLRLREKFSIGERDAGKINASAVLQAQQDVRDGLPLATGTLAKPLVHSGQLLGAVSHEVKPA